MTSDGKSKTYILDTSAILSGKQIDLDNIDMLTTIGVTKEIGPGGKDYFLFQVLLEKKLKIQTPSKESIKKINEVSLKTGDSTRLSEVDKEILALALDIKKEGKIPIIVTDDYSIQNVAQNLDLEFIGISQQVITKKFKWIYQCRGCGRKFKKNVQICPVCGDNIKNKISKKEDIKK